MQIYFVAFSVSIPVEEIFLGGQIISFEEAFTQHPYDVERIAEETGLAPPEVDRLINELVERRHHKRIAYRRRPA